MGRKDQEGMGMRIKGMGMKGSKGMGKKGMGMKERMKAKDEETRLRSVAGRIERTN
jgi:hypothetical protein